MRAAHCLGAQETEVEIESGIEELSSVWVAASPSDGTALSSLEFGNDEDKPGYLRQEVEGIGGVVKKKVKKRVRVGKTVTEFEDERERSEYLGREMRGGLRSWCGWCGRVILGKADLEGLKEMEGAVV